MKNLQPRTLITALIVIVGCAAISFIFHYIQNDAYRSIAPLIFITGLTTSLIILFGSTLSQRPISKNEQLFETKRHYASKQRDLEDLLWRKGIPQLATTLYLNHIQHYPTWHKQGSDYIPASVTEATHTAEGHVCITLYGAMYHFRFQEFMPDKLEDTVQRGLLEIFRNEERVIALIVAEQENEGRSEWFAQQIEAVTMGSWITDIEGLKQEIVVLIKEHERMAREH